MNKPQDSDFLVARQPNKTCADLNEESEKDLTGRNQLVANVLYSWLSHFVFIIAGFILPRLINNHLGQDLLGIWDFSWSLVSYFGFVQAGIGSSVNRYVARYYAANDVAGLNKIVSSAFCVLAVAGMIVLGLVIAVPLLMPWLFGAQLGDNVLDAQWVVFLLGTNLAVEITFNVFAGLLTGCHRWKLHNIIKSGWYIVTVAGMIVVLLMDGNLPNLAAVYLAGQVLASISRAICAYRICKGLRVRPSLARWSTIRSLLAFGGKTLAPSASKLLLSQTTNVLIVAYMGPAALALYARSNALIRHLDTLVHKMAMPLTPTTSSLQSTGNIEGIRALLIKSVRYSCYLALPMVLIIAIFGSPILTLWMGPSYASDVIPAILAIGSFTFIVQRPLLNIFTGLNAHGRAGIAQFIASLCSAGLMFLVLGPLDWGLAGAALAVTLPLTITYLVYLPVHLCHRLELPIGHYFMSALVRPILHILLFAICLLIARFIFSTQLLKGLIWGSAVGGMILAVIYWQCVLPERIKNRILLGLK